MKQMDLTEGVIWKKLLIYAAPVVFSSLLQSAYSIADLIIAGWVIGDSGLSAINNSSQVMVVLTQIIMGITTGGNILMGQYFGGKDHENRKKTNVSLFTLAVLAGAVMTGVLFLLSRSILVGLHAPALEEATAYLQLCALGLVPIFGYNALSSMLRAVGNSVVPLAFLAVSAGLNIALDLWFVLGLRRGAAGAAEATVIAQYVSGLGIAAYTLAKHPELRPAKGQFRLRWFRVREIAGFSILTCVQQSVMNLGILLVQGLVNSFGPTVMAAFAAAVKIDAFAYMPVQDFGNAFSTFIAQNYGARQETRIRAGLRGAVAASMAFCLVVSALVFAFARPLMGLFVEAKEAETILEGVRYLRIEGAFYCGIGCLFLLYGLYRALGRPGMSVVLTVVSLGTRVALAHILSAVPAIGVAGIWWSVPIGWLLADLAGLGYYLVRQKKLFVWPDIPE